jgi:hypothetical protein
VVVLRGEFVVDCVVKMVMKRSLFRGRKTGHLFELYFGLGSLRWSRLLLGGGRGGGVGGGSAWVGTEDKECRDGGDDDADNDEDHERIGEACSFARRSGGRVHGSLDA